MSSSPQPRIVSHIVRKRLFEPRSIDELVQIIKDLMRERHTGPVVVSLSQGGIRGISAEDQAALNTSLDAPKG